MKISDMRVLPVPGRIDHTNRDGSVTWTSVSVLHHIPGQPSGGIGIRATNVWRTYQDAYGRTRTIPEPD